MPVWLASVSISILFCTLPAAVKPQERVCLFPTYGHLSPDRTRWEINLQGWLYEDKPNSLIRKLLVDYFRHRLGVKRRTPEADVLKTRAGFFVTDNERRTKIGIKMGDQSFPAGKTDQNGQFQVALVLTRQEIAGLLHTPPTANAWIEYTLLAHRKATPHGVGKVKLVSPEGVSVISDIDDTMKVTDTLGRSRKAIMADTFAGEYQAVAGMPELYRRLAERGVEFHYVTGGPWQLYTPLAQFFTQTGFPEGYWHLKSFDWLTPSAFRFFRSPEKRKIPAIEQILTDFPRRKFLFIGDNVEKDPEIYGEEARKHPDQVLHIYIRNVRGDSRGSDRYLQAFRSLPASLWSLYTHPEEIALPVKESSLR